MKLEGTINRYIGTSKEPKPRPGMIIDGATVQAKDLPAGSSFMEEDTGRVFRYDGIGSWSQEDQLLDELRGLRSTMEAVLVEMKAANREREIGLPVSRGI